MTGDARFIDEGHPIYEFVAEPIAVHCPRCDARAELIPLGDQAATLHSARRLACAACGFVRDHDGRVLSFSANGHDPCFGYPLWYRAETSQGVIWAYHRRHLNLLRAFVAADLRQRTEDAAWRNRSYFSRLPKWLKSTKNRTAILNRIDRMASTWPK